MQNTSIGRMIFVPTVLTLVVTVLRLIGEMRQWSETLFNRSLGGPGAIVGIIWLGFIFAIYFAVKLQQGGEGVGSGGKAIGVAVGSLVLFVVGTTLMFRGQSTQNLLISIVGIVVILISLAVMRIAWASYWNVMMAYALAARIPVLIVTYLAIQGNWNTHYNAAPPNEVFSSLGDKFVKLGILPQVFFWIPVTIILCGLLGVITAAILKRRGAPAAA